MREQELRASYWLLSSRALVRRLAFGLFVAFDLILLLVAAVQGSRYFGSAGNFEASIAALASSAIPYENVNERIRPQPLTVVSTAILSAREGAFDLVAIAKNPGDRWAVLQTSYEFLLDGEVVAEGTESFFPSEERALVAFGVSLARVSSASKLTVRFPSVTWQRVLSRRELPDIRLTVAQPLYTILSSVPGNPLSQVTANVKNESVFPLPTLTVTAALQNSGAIVGVGRLTLNDVAALETRPIDMRFTKTFTVTKVLVFATVDLAVLSE